MLDRRTLLRMGGAGAVARLLGPVGPALAAEAAPNRMKFVYVVNYGGWDPTRVFAAEFDNPAVDMERDAGLSTAGGLAFVDHTNRPSVRAYFERHHARSLVVKGVLVPSIAHENCLKWQMTGTTNEGASDWPAILASARADAYPIPHMVVAGPSFPGELGGVVTRTGASGQLAALLSGDILGWSTVPTEAPTARAGDVMDAYLERRALAAAQAAAGRADGAWFDAFSAATGQSLDLKNLQSVVNFSSGSSFSAQCRLAAEVLAQSVARCVTVNFSYYGWDTHVANDLYQSSNFEMLFAGLNELMDRLASTPGEFGGTLADETMVVVLSEMGRTPQLNAGDGKDHWPYTSVLFTGPGITGDRVVGGYDALYYGRSVDPSTGELSDGGVQITSAALGATLLQLCDIDPAEFVAGTDPIPGLLRG